MKKIYLILLSIFSFAIFVFSTEKVLQTSLLKNAVLTLQEQFGHSKKVVVIGAGIAGLTTAYQLYKMGFDVKVYEARERIGGRIFSVFVNGSIAELGGGNIADGGDAANIHALISELGLAIEEGSVSFKHAFHHQNELIYVDELLKKKFKPETLKDELYALQQTSASMRELLNQLFSPDDPLNICLSTRLAGYEGASAERLSSCYVETLYYMILGGICAAHQGNETAFQHIQGGNSRLPEALAQKLGNRVHCNMPLVSLVKDQQGYLLTFKDGSTTRADIVVLALPCPVYNDVEFGQDVMPSEKLNAIRSICNGDNAKILVPLSGSFDNTTIFVNNYFGIFSFCSNLTTLYFTGQASRFANGIEDTYANAQSLLSCAVEKSLLPESNPVCVADKAFSHYDGPVGHSWPNDPYAKGTYSYIAPGQEKFFSLITHKGFEVKTLFEPIDNTLYFAGEHASTLIEVPGTMEAACQSGNLVATMIQEFYDK